MGARARVLAFLALMLAGLGQRPPCWPQASSSDPVAAITHVQGSGAVEVHAPDGSVRKAKARMALRVGDRVIADPPSRTTVIYLDRPPKTLNAAAGRVEWRISPAPPSTLADKALRVWRSIWDTLFREEYVIDPAAGVFDYKWRRRYRSSDEVWGAVRVRVREWGTVPLPLAAAPRRSGRCDAPPDWRRAYKAREPAELQSLLVASIPTPTLSLIAPEARVFRWSPTSADYHTGPPGEAGAQGPWHVVLRDFEGDELWRSAQTDVPEVAFPERPTLQPCRTYHWHVTDERGRRIVKGRDWWFAVARPDDAQRAADDMAFVQDCLEEDFDDVTRRALRSAILMEHGFCDAAEEELLEGLVADSGNEFLVDLLEKAMVGATPRLAWHARPPRVPIVLR